MGSYSSLIGASATQVIIYYLVVIISLVYLYKKFGTNKYTLVVNLMLWEGVFGFLHKINVFPIQYFRLLVVIFLILIFGKSIFNTYKSSFKINISFSIFSLFFIISFFINGGSIFTTFSQYFFQFAALFIIYKGLDDKFRYNQFRVYFVRLITFAVLVQIVLSIFKFIILGGTEAIVGSISAKGAGPAVVLPILGFILLWITKRNKWTKKEWLIALSLYLIAFVSNKRSPVFTFPVIILLMGTYESKSFSFNRLLKFVPFVLIMFYVTTRLNPSLNPDKEKWGAFDLNYTIEYALQYNFGVKDIENIGSQYAEAGRGRGFLNLVSFNKMINTYSTKELLFGQGVAKVNTMERGEAEYSKEIGQMGVGGYGLKSFFMFGYIGLVTYLIFIAQLIKSTHNRRLRIILLVYVFWEFFFYGGVTITSNATSLILVTIILFSNYTSRNNNLEKLNPPLW